MKRHFIVIQSLLIPLMLFTRVELSFSVEPLSDIEIRELAGKIKGKYENYVYTVNAYSRIPCDKNIKLIKSKTTRMRKKVGTAFPLDNQGHLITLSCVVKQAEKVYVISRSGEEFPADVVDSVKSGRIAILKITPSFTMSPPPATPWNSINAGNKVILLCICPENKLTAKPGTISDVRNSDGSIIVSVSGNPETTAGTPVFDTNEHLLGILAFRVEHQKFITPKTAEKNNSYIVIPMEYASVIFRSIINKPETRKGWLGIFISEKDNNLGGVDIQYVVQGSPAAKCGLKPTDCITEFNGVPVSSTRQMIEAASSTRAGDTVFIKILRNGEMLSFNATLF